MGHPVRGNPLNHALIDAKSDKILHKITRKKNKLNVKAKVTSDTLNY